MIRIAIIGAGIFVRETYIPLIQANGAKVKLTAILSRSAESIEQTLLLLRNGCDRESVLRYCGDDGEEKFFCQAKEICDAVIIVVPIPLLGSYVERCLSLGIHILSEKPVAMTSGEAIKLIDLYRQENRQALWHVAENYRLEPAICYAAEIVKNHALRPKSFALTALRQQTTTSKYAVTSWRAKPAYNGSFVLDGGIHFVALLRTVFGAATVHDIHSIYQEQSVVEVGAVGACRVDDALGTFQIRYGDFSSVVCRLDIYWDDAIMNIIQHKGVGYEVTMTGKESRHFAFEGLTEEFRVWMTALDTGIAASELSPEEGLQDLLVVEEMCSPRNS